MSHVGARVARSSAVVCALILCACEADVRAPPSGGGTEPGPTRTPISDPPDDGVLAGGVSFVYSLGSGSRNVLTISGQTGAVSSVTGFGGALRRLVVAPGTDLAMIIDPNPPVNDAGMRESRLVTFCPNDKSPEQRTLEPGLDTLSTLGSDGANVGVVAYRASESTGKDETNAITLVRLTDCGSVKPVVPVEPLRVRVGRSPHRLFSRPDRGDGLILHATGLSRIDGSGEVTPIAGLDAVPVADVTLGPASSDYAVARVAGTRRIVLIDVAGAAAEMLELPRGGAVIATAARLAAVPAPADGGDDGSTTTSEEAGRDASDGGPFPGNAEDATDADAAREASSSDAGPGSDPVYALALSPSGTVALAAQGTALTRIDVPLGFRNATGVARTATATPIETIAFGSADDCALGYTRTEQSLEILKLTEDLELKRAIVLRDVDSATLFCKPAEGSAPATCCDGVAVVRHPKAPSAPLGRNFGFSLVDIPTQSALFVPTDMDVTAVAAFAGGRYVLVALSDLERSRGELRIISPFAYTFGAPQAMRTIATRGPSVALGELAGANAAYLGQQDRDGHLTLIDAPTPQSWLKVPYPVREVFGFRLADRVQTITLDGLR